MPENGSNSKKVQLPDWLKAGKLWKNIGGAAFLLLFFFLMVNLWLKLYTHHGERYLVGDYTGMELIDASRMASSKTFQIVIIDSIFRLDMGPGIVLNQNPAPGTGVKRNRKIYLTVTASQPPMVNLPSLAGNYNFEAYERKLGRIGVQAQILTKEYNETLEENTIIGVYYKDEKITESDLRVGYAVPQGSTISFVITERFTGKVPIPNLVCRTFATASFLLSSSQLMIGDTIGDYEFLESAYVWRQEPAYIPNQQIPIGTKVDLFLQTEAPQGCPDN